MPQKKERQRIKTKIETKKIVEVVMAESFPGYMNSTSSLTHY